MFTWKTIDIWTWNAALDYCTRVVTSANNTSYERHCEQPARHVVCSTEPGGMFHMCHYLNCVWPRLLVFHSPWGTQDSTKLIKRRNTTHCSWRFFFQAKGPQTRNQINFVVPEYISVAGRKINTIDECVKLPQAYLYYKIATAHFISSNFRLKQTLKITFSSYGKMVTPSIWEKWGICNFWGWNVISLCIHASEPL
jgi:hypothetical protein